MLNDNTKKIEDHGGVLFGTGTGTLTKYDKPITRTPKIQKIDQFQIPIRTLSFCSNLQDDNE